MRTSALQVVEIEKKDKPSGALVVQVEGSNYMKKVVRVCWFHIITDLLSCDLHLASFVSITMLQSSGRRNRSSCLLRRADAKNVGIEGLLVLWN